MTYWIPLKTKLRAVNLVRKGASVRQAAEKIGCCRNSIRNWVNRYGQDFKKKDPRANQYTIKTRAKAIEMVLNGKTMKDTAKEIGCCWSTVRNWVRQDGTYREKEVDRRNWSVDLYIRGHSLSKVSEMTGMSREAVRKNVERRGYERRGPGGWWKETSDEEKKRTLKLYESGMTFAEVHRMTGHDPKTVRKWRDRK